MAGLIYISTKEPSKEVQDLVEKIRIPTIENS
jgi:hypothetical protein